MSTAGNVAFPVPHYPASRSRVLGVFANLLRMELSASRGIVIAGLWIFWLMPAFLEGTYMLFVDRQHTIVSGLAWITLFVAGWLYAIVTGGHVVCRDWGKDEEHFLLAQPVSPRWIVCAKLLAGACVLVAVSVIAGVWDVTLWWHDPTGIRPGDLGVAAAIIACAMTVGFLVAFATAVVTRQMLTSVLVATLVLLIWTTGPLLSRHLTILYPPVARWDLDTRNASVEIETYEVPLVLLGGTFLALLGLVIVASIAVSLIAATRERVLQLGQKSLAWAAAVVVLTLFGLAMTEVGSSLVVRDVAPLLPHGHVRTPVPQWRPEWTFDRRGDQCLMTVGANLVRFRVDERGQIEGVEQANLLQDGNADTPSLTALSARLAERGDCVVTGILYPRLYRPGEGEPPRIARARYRWPTGGDLVRVDRILVGPFGDKEVGRTLRSHALTDRWAYLVYAVKPNPDDTDAPRNTNWWMRELYIYDWQGAADPQPRHRARLGVGRDIRLVHGKLVVYNKENHVPQLNEFYVFDVDDPDTLAGQLEDPDGLTGLRMSPWHRAMIGSELGASIGLHTRYEAYDAARELRYTHDIHGLKVEGSPEKYPPSRHGLWADVGLYRPSPIATAVRSGSRDLTLVDDTFLIEMGYTTLSAYDVSDPTRPRRAGFFHLGAVGPSGRPQVFATNRHLIVPRASHLIVLDRPQAEVK